MRLTLEGEGDTDLVGSLVEFLGVEGSTETKSDTSAELDVVGKGSKTLIVDLGLFSRVSRKRDRMVGKPTFAKEVGSSLYLVATSRPTFDPAFESQIALAPASTSVLTLW